MNYGPMKHNVNITTVRMQCWCITAAAFRYPYLEQASSLACPMHASALLATDPCLVTGERERKRQGC